MQTLKYPQGKIVFYSWVVNMSLTDKQKTFLLRKMKTRFERIDIDKNG